MIPVDALREWLGSDESEDAIIEVMEASAVALVEQHTGLSLGTPAQRVDVVPGSGTSILFLPAGASTSAIASITERSYAGDAGTALVVDDDYELRGARLIRRNGALWSGLLEYVVTSTAGYVEGPATAQYRRAVLQLVALDYAQKDAEGLQSEKLGTYSYSSASASGGGQGAVAAVLATLPRRIRV